MSLETIVYSVLIVSSSKTFNNSTLDILPVSHYQPIHFSSSINEAKRNLSERNYDLIIINAPLPDDSGTRFAIDCCQSNQTVVLMMVRNDIHDEIYAKVAPHGVFTLPKPTSKTIILQALNWVSSARERLRKLEKKNLTVEERMEEIRIINRAKLILVSELHMTEPESHRYIEKQSMDNCVTKREMAEIIIKTYM